jgi:hypothetical protein
MPTKIQVKRATTAATPSSLDFGEFGYTTNGSVLFIGQDAGDSSNVIAIGGARVPGTLTANQAIVVNANSMIDVIRIGNSTSNAVVNSTSIKVTNSTVNSLFSVPTAAQYEGNFFLHANGSWATPAGGVGGSNTHVQFNDSGTAGASAGLTFDKTSNTLTIGNTLVVPNITANVTLIGNSTVNVFTATGNSTVTEFRVTGSVANVQSSTVTVVAPTVDVTSNTQNYRSNSTVTGLSIVGNSTVTGVTVGTGASFTNVVSTNVSINSTNTTVASNVTINGTNLTVSSNASFSANVTISGDLIVNGTVATINVDTITVEDSIIRLASNNLTTNTIDFGIYGVSGNSTVTDFSGIFRDTSNSQVWTLFTTRTEPTTTVDTGAGTYARGSLLANFITEVFTANSTKVSITAGALLADLEVQDGGTGVGAFTNKGVIYGNTAGPLGVTAAGTDGQVLQANSTGFPVFAMLDGGTF